MGTPAMRPSMHCAPPPVSPPAKNDVQERGECDCWRDFSHERVQSTLDDSRHAATPRAFASTTLTSRSPSASIRFDDTDVTLPFA